MHFRKYCLLLLITTVSITSTHAQDLISNLEAHWTFDDFTSILNTSTAVDDSGMNRDASVSTGLPFPVAGKTGNALSFDGLSDLTTPWKGIGGDTPRTISLWVRTNQQGNAFVNWGTRANGSNWRFGVRGSNPNMMGPPPGSLSVDIEGAGTFGRGQVNIGEWLHVACVYDGGALNETVLYVNGMAEPQGPPPPPDREVVPVDTNVDSNDSPDLTIGSFEGNNGPVRFNGAMDDIRIYSRALTQEEIQALFALGENTQAAATRTFSQSSIEVGSSINVTLTPPTSSQITEMIPTGWTITEVSNNAIVENNTITWANSTLEESYTITLDDGAAGTRFVGDVNGLITDGDYEVNILTEGAGTFTQTADIGSSQTPGSAEFFNGTYLLQGSGSGIGDSEDSFYYLFKPVSGPFRVRGNALVIPLDVSADYENIQGGLMIRNDLTASSSNAFISVNGDLLMSAQSRSQNGEDTNLLAGEIGDQLGDIELVRNGNFIEYFYTNNSGSSVSLGQTQISDLTDPLYVGVALTSGDINSLSELEMTDVEIIEENYSAIRTIESSGNGRIKPGDTLTVTISFFNRNDIPFVITEDVPLAFTINTIQTSGGTAQTNTNGLIEWSLDQAGDFQLTYEIQIPNSITSLNPEQSEFLHTYRSTVRSDNSTVGAVVGNNVIRIPLLLSEDLLANQDTTTGLEGHWSFDEGSGTSTANATSNNRDAIFRNGNAGWVEGVQGSALEFTGDDDLEVPDYYSISGNAPRTTTLWMRTQNPGGPHAMVIWGGSMGSGQKWDIQVHGGPRSTTPGTLRVDNFGSFVAGNTVLQDDEWHHVAVVFPDDGVLMRDILLYVDGLIDHINETDENNGNLEVDTVGEETGGNPLVFGSRQGGNGNEFYRGLLDEIRIYSRALTPEQIQAIYVSERPDSPPNSNVDNFMLY